VWDSSKIQKNETEREHDKREKGENEKTKDEHDERKKGELKKRRARRHLLASSPSTIEAFGKPQRDSIPLVISK